MFFPSYEKESRPSAFTAARSVKETTRPSERASGGAAAGTFNRSAATTASNKSPAEPQPRWLTTHTFSFFLPIEQIPARRDYRAACRISRDGGTWNLGTPV